MNGSCDLADCPSDGSTGGWEVSVEINGMQCWEDLCGVRDGPVDSGLVGIGGRKGGGERTKGGNGMVVLAGGMGWFRIHRVQT